MHLRESSIDFEKHLSYIAYFKLKRSIILKSQPILLLSIFVIVVAAIFTLLYKDTTLQIIVKIFKLNSHSFTAETYRASNFRLCKPPGLKGTINSSKKYPLVVYLHGAGERGSDNRKQSYDLTFLGNGFSKQARIFQQKHPCFVYVPQCPNNSYWDETVLSTVIQTIEHLISLYPIDKKRLYLIGYSMGGSGTYSLSYQYYEYNKTLFAGIIRLAGQSSFDDHVHKLIAKSAVWLHIGLKDNPLRVERVREAYNILKVINNEAIESIEPIAINNHQGRTWSLKINKVNRYNKSEYENDDHSISHFPFRDSSLLEWLFEKKLPY
jgi:predicted peptidase